jgi:hypothetical protein
MKCNGKKPVMKCNCKKPIMKCNCKKPVKCNVIVRNQ